MTYCTDADMASYRPNIMDLGKEDWEDQREEAFSMINRVIEARWYRKVAQEMGISFSNILVDTSHIPFDPDKVKTGFLTRLEAFKALELAYMFLKKDSPQSDGFERNEKTFRDRYNEELELILSIGVEYDWDDSGEVEQDERYIRQPRRLVRS